VSDSIESLEERYPNAVIYRVSVPCWPDGYDTAGYKIVSCSRMAGRSRRTGSLRHGRSWRPMAMAMLDTKGSCQMRKRPNRPQKAPMTTTGYAMRNGKAV
jgi:hypothetical protein